MTASRRLAAILAADIVGYLTPASRARFHWPEKDDCRYG